MVVIESLLTLVEYRASQPCAPSWYAQRLQCPYGHSFKAVSLTWPNEDVGFLTFVAAFYSMVPFFVSIVSMLALLVRRGVSNVLVISFQVIAAGGVVIILKHLFRQPRPIGSCLSSCGFPSGHATVTIGLLTWVVLEVALSGRWAKEKRRCVLVLVLAVMLLGPVGWSRTVLHDHSWKQVIAGSMVGIVVGALWLLLLRLTIGPRFNEAAQKLGLRPDYPLDGDPIKSEAGNSLTQSSEPPAAYGSVAM